MFLRVMKVCLSHEGKNLESQDRTSQNWVMSTVFGPKKEDGDICARILRGTKWSVFYASMTFEGGRISVVGVMYSWKLFYYSLDFSLSIIRWPNQGDWREWDAGENKNAQKILSFKGWTLRTRERNGVRVWTGFICLNVRTGIRP